MRFHFKITSGSFALGFADTLAKWRNEEHKNVEYSSSFTFYNYTIYSVLFVADVVARNIASEPA